MSDLDLTHAEYIFYKANWQLVRDLIKGESALKDHDLSGLSNYQNRVVNSTNTFKLNERYLPIPDATNCGTDNVFRYSQYVQRASLFNATKRTLQGMSGMVFNKPATIDLPESVKYLEDDADGSEVGIEQQAQEVLSDILQTGREGLLVDFPARESETTKQEAEDLAVRANIVVYKAESIVDWDTIKVNAAHKLSYVKLAEIVTERDPDNLFKTVDTKQFRVLILNDDGNYEQRIYKDSIDDFVPTVPVDANAKPFDYIPFFFIGSVNNRPNVDPAPLTEIAEVNLAHYRNSADFEESSFVVGQPMLVIAGLSKAWADEYFKNGVNYGARSAALLPEGGSASLVQAGANTMPENGMDRKEGQMIQLGARLVVDGGAAETAEAARIKHGADASVLSIVVRNINQAYEDAIEAAMQFMIGTPAEFEFMINNEFFSSKISPEEILAVVGAWQANLYTRDEAQFRLQQGGFFKEDINLEEVNEKLDLEPSPLDFDEV